MSGSVNAPFPSIGYTSNSDIRPLRPCKIIPNEIPSGETPFASASISEGELGEAIAPSTAKPRLGQPQPHRDVTVTFGMGNVGLFRASFDNGERMNEPITMVVFRFYDPRAIRGHIARLSFKARGSHPTVKLHPACATLAGPTRYRLC